jgi:transposase-like protein
MAQSPQEQIVTLEQAAVTLDIKPRTLYNWLREAQITPLQFDKKTKGITQAQLEELARLHGRLLPGADLAERVRQLEERVQQLESWRSTWEVSRATDQTKELR